MKIISIEHPPEGSEYTVRYSLDELRHTIACLGALTEEEIKIELLRYQILAPEDAVRAVRAGESLYNDLLTLTEKNQ